MALPNFDPFTITRGLEFPRGIPDQVIEVLASMEHDTLLNYIAPGLNSSLIGGTGKSGCVRVFKSQLDQVQPITPHSHRYDFACLVLRGAVTNRIWQRSKDQNATSYQCSQLIFNGKPGQCEVHQHGEIDTWSFKDHIYRASEWYSMKAEQFHSIYFSKGAIVLFFEGAQRLEHSYVLQPYTNGQVVPTFKVEPWMFKRNGQLVDGGLPDAFDKGAQS